MKKFRLRYNSSLVIHGTINTAFMTKFGGEETISENRILKKLFWMELLNHVKIAKKQ